MAYARRRCYSHDKIHHRPEQERTELVSALVLVPALELALASALVSALASTLVRLRE